jgi:flavin reductase (DIM6/NTAB) family NADH-FMN oxidoreductase RutF
MPPNSSSTSYPFHSATLSSFTSIAMDPYPLIAFALRMPSRMASSLDAAQPGQASHMVVNLLSAEQASISVKFSRPDWYPEPFSSIPYSLSEEGLPIIDDALGAISCKVVSKAIPLQDLELLKGESSEEMMNPLLEDCPSSKLFIAHATRVKSSPSEQRRTVCRCSTIDDNTRVVEYHPVRRLWTHRKGFSQVGAAAVGYHKGTEVFSEKMGMGGRAGVYDAEMAGLMLVAKLASSSP